MPIFRKRNALSGLCLLYLASQLIQTGTHYLLLLLRKALYSGAEKLEARKHPGSCCGCNGLIGAWSWLLVLIVDHFSEFSLERVIGFVDLRFEMGFDGLGGEDSRRTNLFLTGCAKL